MFPWTPLPIDYKEKINSFLCELQFKIKKFLSDFLDDPNVNELKLNQTKYENIPPAWYESCMMSNLM